MIPDKIKIIYGALTCSTVKLKADDKMSAAMAVLFGRVEFTRNFNVSDARAACEMIDKYKVVGK